MSRGRGRGRVRFGGSRDPMLADIMDETREDLGLSHAQMEQLNAEAVALYPPVELPHPEALTNQEAYLIQRQRILAHKLESLYHPWETDPAGPDARPHASDLAAFVHVTVPEIQKPEEVYVPEELGSNSRMGTQLPSTTSAPTRGIMQPRAFDSVFKSLEAQEKKKATEKANAVEQDAEDGTMDDVDEDLGDDMNDYTFDYYDSDAVSNEGDEEVFF
ncbi:hypothetical protein PsorP6_013053 [Peronosclerospora sorghi]|uniref:Uncharacterized protein n=1 Tax=Peronosclerospora sorghi TaxID=230839 RepID=A0ACC0WEC6_9STRA|nr:hypothetical protein PsorP6_013053 [Peronosclerospora sorghi]